jgi:FkbM family methyltransferase
MIKYIQGIDEAIKWIINDFNEKKYLKKTFKNKKITFIDIGTNYGLFYSKISKIFRIKRALLIDPLPKLKNKLSNICILNLGVTNKKCLKIFYEHKISSQSSFYKRNNKLKIISKIKAKKLIKCDKLDNIINNYKIKFIDLLKIDAQHEELNVLKGSRNILKKKLIKMIKIEINLISFYKNKKNNFFEIISLLKKYKYNLSTISKIKYIDNEVALIDAYFKRND